MGPNESIKRGKIKLTNAEEEFTISMEELIA